MEEKEQVPGWLILVPLGIALLLIYLYSLTLQNG